MKFRVIVFSLLVYVSSFKSQGYTESLNLKAQARFEENKGQLHQNVKYKVDLINGHIFYEKTGFTIAFNTAAEAYESLHDGDKNNSNGIAETVKADAIKAKYINSNINPAFIVDGQSQYYKNYYVGKDRSKWASNVHLYDRMLIKDIYPGIDLNYTSNTENIKYDVVIHKGSNPSVYQLLYQGHQELYADANGNLIMKSRLGQIKELKPISYQIINGVKVDVKVNFKVSNNEQVSFEFPEGYNLNYDLVIDPYLVASTLTGSTADNWGFTACPGLNGQMRVAGIAFAAGYPVTAGAYDNTFNGGTDISISFFSANGSTLQASTYLGGTGNDYPHSIITATNGDLVLVGRTESNNFPTTVGCYDATFNGGTTDMIVCRLNSGLTGLLASTYVGGSGLDATNVDNSFTGTAQIKFSYADTHRSQVRIDNAGNIVISSNTQSADWPTTAGCYDNALSGVQDGVVLKLNTNLTTLLFSTYIGGAGYDACQSVQIDATNDIYVAGTTNSNNFPTTAGVINPATLGGVDGFVFKMNSTGSGLTASTYLGTANKDGAFNLDLQNNGNIHVYGLSDGGAYPTTASTYSNANSCQFIHGLNNTLTSTIYSTKFGNGVTPNLSPTAFAVDSCNNIYACGWARNFDGGTCTGMSTTSGAYQTTTDGRDFYFLTLTPNATSLLYATFFGQNGGTADHVDGGTSLFSNNPGDQGVVYQAVCSTCGGATSGFPTTTNAYSANDPGPNCNNAVFKFDLETYKPGAAAVAGTGNGCAGSPITFTNNSTNATSYIWNFGDASPTSTVVNPSHTYTAAGVYTGTLIAFNLTTCIGSVQTVFTLTVSPNPTVTINITSGTNPTCAGNTVNLQASGASTYTWNPGNINTTTISVSPTITTQYTVVGTSTAGCTGTVIYTLVVNPNPTVVPAVTAATACAGASRTLTATGATTYTWLPGSVVGASVVVTPTATIIYTVTGANATGCSNTRTIQVNVTPNPTIVPAVTAATACAGATRTLSATGATTYTWVPGSLSGASVVVTPTATLIYTVTGANASGCTSSQTIQVNVTPNPTIVPAVTAATACAGASRTLSATGATTYTWMPGSLAGASVVVTPTTTLTYTVTGANTSGCTSTQTIQVNVTPNPTVVPAVTAATACAGASRTLSATGATTYTWMPGSLPGASVVVTPTATLIYTVTGANASGCASSQTIQVNVTPNPTVNTTASPTAICVGGTSTLTATGAVTYTWLPGSTVSASIAVSPTLNTTYSVTGVNASGCVNTRTLLLTVSPNPTVIPAVTAATACAGASRTLSATGATTYTWMPGSIVGASVVVTPTSTLTYTVMGTNPGGCSSSQTIQVNVTPNPTVVPAVSPLIACAGASRTLSATGATSYTWMPGSLAGASVVVTPTATLVYTVTGANASGCVNTRTIQVNVNSNPTVNATASPTAICLGGTGTLTATGAVTYTWLPSSLISASIAVTPTSSTVYTVTGTNASGCTGTRTVQLTVTPNPTVSAVSPPTICIGQTVSLVASGANTYTWNPGSLTGATVVVSPTTTTSYTVLGTNATGCNSNSFVVTVTVTGTCPDHDGDGIPDYVDLDDDNDGIPDLVEGTGDTDGDGVPDAFDLDSDNDGIFDLWESGLTSTQKTTLDPDGDGIVNGPVGSNGIPNAAETFADSGISIVPIIDTDGDGIPNYKDLDSDNDGIFDVTENGNGALDANNDGVVDGTDTDGDGIINVGPIDTNTSLGGNNATNVDTDGDGIPNSIDLDSDNDGIFDVIEGGNGSLDTNNDGLVNGTDTDGDGIINVGPIDTNTSFGGTGSPAPDKDGDGVPNYLDLDSDNDGIFDVVESGNGSLDTNNDGLVNGTDTDGDGIVNVGPIDTNTSFGGTGSPAPDKDGDGVANYLDLDSDNDGIFDVVESGNGSLDTNNDGLVNGTDTDGDGIVNVGPIDTNTSFGGTGSPAPDKDGDGVPNYLDLDSDNDGIFDVVESGNGSLDTNNDGLVNGTDTDGDGIVNVGPIDTNTIFGGTGSPAPDKDADGVANYLDLDSDNDGIFDVVEGGNGSLDTNNDGLVNGTDTDGDGIVNVGPIDTNTSFGGTGSPAPDKDGDGVPNYLDLDSDNDGIFDVVESGNGSLDTNNDGLVNGTDTDGDGIVNVGPIDTNTTFGGTGSPAPDKDGDGVANYLDLDSDNDGIFDVVEGGNGSLDTNNDGLVNGTDTDGDGIVNVGPIDTNTSFGGTGSPAPDKDGDGVPNYLDLDSDNDGIFDVVEGGNGSLDTNNDGLVNGTDTDGDGIVNVGPIDTNTSFGGTGSPAPDNDGDSVANYLDLDADNDGIFDIVEGGNSSLDANSDGVVDGTDTDSDGIVNVGPIDTNTSFGGTGSPAPDRDSDGVANYLDLDSDNDGIFDVVESGNGSLDTNNDGLVNGTDTDGDGIVNVGPIDTNTSFGGTGSPTPDKDTDGVANYLDLDSDNDGVFDVVENGNSTLDANSDGLVDGTDTDSDGIVNVGPIDTNTSFGGTGSAVLDTDGDATANYLDLDSDNDGIFDVVEGGNASLDTNNDGVVNGTDSDNDGIVNVSPIDTNTSFGGTGTSIANTDGDGMPNFIDLDSDDDGIFDVVENGNATLDTDNDGVVNGTDTDNDGIINVTAIDNNTTFGGTSVAVANFDGDSAPNYLDLDADNDGILDIVENGNAALDANTNGLVDGSDTDNDGIVNVGPIDTNTSFGGTGTVTVNSDTDTKPNYLDIDTDNDGIVDNVEGQATATYSAPANADSDSDGIDNTYDNFVGFGGSGVNPVNNNENLDDPDYLDLDTDNDGKPDLLEGWDMNGDGLISGTEKSPNTLDVDSDGLDDGFDSNTALVDPTNGTTPLFHPDVIKPGGDRDWRENDVIIGMAKAASTPTLNNDGTYSVRYDIMVKNMGAVPLTNVTIIENLSNTFPLPTTYSITSNPIVASVGTSITLNSSFNGSTQSVITVPATSSLAVGKTDTISFTVRVSPNGYFGPFNNTAIGSASSGTVTVADSSSTGYDPDPNGNGNPSNPGEGTPTIVNFPPKVLLGIAKAASVPVKLSDNTYDVTYTITVKNMGNDTLRNVQVIDNLSSAVPSPASYVIKSGPTASGSLVINSGFNGSSDVNMLNATASKLKPFANETIIITINITPSSVKRFSNTAIGSAVGQNSIATSDTSGTGFNPDVNDNGNPNEPSDNQPTVFDLPDDGFNIPQGFSPNNDGVNDVFVIKGITRYPDNKLTILNRWGNLVYKVDGYNNTWNGKNTEGIKYGGDDLPEGTYFYILDLGNGEKPMKGYVYLSR